MNSVVKQRIADIQRGNIPAGYRKTKLGIVPTDWNEVPLDSILQKVVRKVPKPQAAYWRLGVRSHAKGTFRELVEDPATVNMDELYSVRANDLVVNITFAWEHAIAIVNEHDSGLLVSHRFPTYTFRNNASPDFYRYVITQKWMKEQLDLISPGGAGRNRVMNKNLFLKISSYLPPLEEQRWIAEILGCCDRVIALKKELIAEKKKQKKVLMHKLLNPDSGFRLPGFSGEWKEFKISEICKIESGGTPATGDEQCWNGDIFWCTPSDITNAGKYISHTPQKITQKGIDTSSATLLPTGSVIMCSRASIGPRCITQVPMATNQGFKNFICSDLLYNEFWYYFIDTILEDLYKMASGNTFKEVSKNSIATYNVTIPSSLKEQKAIADILSAADKEIDLLEQELAQQEQKKKFLMQLLLTGIVRV